MGALASCASMQTTGRQAPAPTPAPASFLAANAATPFQGLITREKEPENLEFPFAALNQFVTDNDPFYVRSHFPVPKIDVATWRLKIEGQGEPPCELSFDELVSLGSRSVMSTI